MEVFVEVKLLCTGDMRSIAHSAWVSTISETQAKRKGDAEVDRVVNFLVDNTHTTPFESVTLTFSFSLRTEGDYAEYDKIKRNKIKQRWVRETSKTDGDKEIISLTTDLFNFVKMMSQYTMTEIEINPFWLSFKMEQPKIAEVVSGFLKYEHTKKYEDPKIDYDKILGKKKEDISVEMISYHDTDDMISSRATWRISCPLSIAVQLLRHRSGSYNMTSARYRTIRQDIVGIFDDISDIANRSGRSEELNLMFEDAQVTSSKYEREMLLFKEAKDQGKITMAEYKRIREFIRYVLPEGRITELYASFYMDDFLSYLILRNSAHAQIEHAYLAHSMYQTLEKHLSEHKKFNFILNN
jgi:thymidylate synthase ThyX